MDDLKYFQFIGIRLEYESLLLLLKNGQFTKKYPVFQYQLFQDTYIIHHNESSAYIYENPKKVILNFENTKKIFFIHSNLDINKYCLNNNIDINDVYLEHGNKFSNWSKIISSNENELNLYYKEKKQLIFDKIKINLLNKDINIISNYSKYYKQYFGNNIEPNSEFKYEHTKNRQNILNNLKILFTSDCTKFKFTGPFNIGKSITLLHFSRLGRNIFYFNLKVLSNENLYDCYNIMIEEFSRIHKKYYDTIMNTIKLSYQKGETPIRCIYDIMSFLSGFNIIFIFIFDHYKSNSFDLSLLEKLDKMEKNIKIVYCSCINNKNIRDECLRTWQTIFEFPEILNIEHQDYYFYYNELYQQNYNEQEPIISQINKVKRFKKLYDDNHLDFEKIYKVTEHIKNKIKEFAIQNDVSFDFVLANIRSILHKNYDITDIDLVMKYCPLKFFSVKFIDKETFIIQLQFPFLKTIIYERLLISEVNDYFEKEKYLEKLIENLTVRQNYFEEAVKFGLKNYIKLPLQIDYIIEVKDITNLEEINKKSIDYYNLDDNSLEDDLDKLNIQENIYNTQNPGDKMNGQCAAKEKEKVILKKETNSRINKEELDKFLKEYNIVLNNSSCLIENTLVWHQNKIIKELYEGNYEIKKSGKNYDGNKTYFLEQRKRTGRTLDCGLLFGEKNNKTFYGFQIKCYFEETKSISKKATDKDTIKEKIKEILINTMFLLNCRITSWHYFLIFYYNKDKQRCNVSPEVINLSKNVEILYYDPLNKRFLNKEKKHLEILEKSYDSNLDLVNINLGKNLINLKISNKNIFRLVNDENLEKAFKNDLKFLVSNNQVKSVNNIINLILNIMEVNTGKYNLIKKIVDLPLVPMFPSYNSIFVYKKNKKNEFLGLKTINDENGKEILKIYDLNNKKEISVIENNYEYFYLLEQKEIRRPDRSKDPIPSILIQKTYKDSS